VELTPDERRRYGRHLVVPEVGEAGQLRLKGGSALVVGAGGLGSPVVLYLGTAGVGRITLVDHDAVDLTNLQRQIAHNLERVGHPKAESAREAVRAINPDVLVRPLVLKVDAQSLDELVPQADVVIDCCDNFATRQAINRACVAHGKPLVSGAAIRFDGQVSVFDTRMPQAPCYACVFPPDQDFEETRCATMGVFAPLVGIIGAMQASEALRILSGVGRSLAGRLQMLDGRSMEWSEVRVKRDPACRVCGPLRG
jgi:molybdopterin/thiamine biosynthesis adenylyltransferase